ncbi:MAG: MarR family transcriptional regulator [Patescibacteria group bacterium]
MHSADKIVDLSIRLSRIMRQRLLAMRDRSPLNMVQLHAIAWVSESRGVTMKDFARHLRISSPSASVFAGRLVRLGLLKRRKDPTDRKRVRLQVSKKGLRLCRAYHAKSHRALRALFHRMPDRDRRTLARILHDFVSDMERDSSS